MSLHRRAALFGVGVVFVSGCTGSSSDGTALPAPSPTTSTVATTTVLRATTSLPVATTISSTVVGGSSPDCSVTVESGDALSKIAARQDITLAELMDENWLADGDVIHPGDRLDVCIGNDIDDVAGTSRLAPAPLAVRRQQEHLNELFDSYRFADLLVDGDSGPLTRQLLCAARMGLGMTVTGGHMAEDSADEEALFAASTLSVPAGAATWSNKWILINNTCQVFFIGEGDELVNVYPTSTGSPGFETRRAQAVEAFRFDPALDNGGWHDSSRFPTSADDPQNGNMYKPIYFNSGQAIHGANYVPPEPRSKGCARTFPHHQDELLDWLGLDDVTEATWQRNQIGVTVTVQGQFRPGR